MRNRLSFAAALSLATSTMLIAPAFAATPTDTITPGLSVVNLLAINDFHGAIDDDGALACSVETAKAGLGEEATAFISVGDNIGATPFVSSYDADLPTIDYLNALQLRASAAGNHEFDRGYADLTGRVADRANFNYLGANVYQRGTTTPALPEFELLTINGVRVAVIGAVTAETPTLVSPDGVTMLDFGDPVAAVNRVATQISADGAADVIVALYHDGADAAAAYGEALSSTTFARMVNETSTLVSAILNGHTHRSYSFDAPMPDGDGTRPIVQAGSGGGAFAQIRLGYDAAAGKVVEYSASVVPAEAPAEGAACLTDPQYVAARQVADRAIADSTVIGQQVIGQISADITTADKSPTVADGVYTGVWDRDNRDDRGHASTLGNLAAQVWLDALNTPGRTGADIGIMNPGGLRAELLYAASGNEADGEVTLGEAAAINPFANTLKTVDLTGAQFKTLLEQQWQPGKSRPYLALGLSDNVFYTYDPARAHGDRITGIWVNGSPIDLAASYTIASGSFLIEGGDNFTVLAQGANRTDSGLVDTDAFMNHFQGKVVSPDHRTRSLAVDAAQTYMFNPEGVVDPAQPFTLTIEGVDLTSLGSPANSTVEVIIDGVSYGSFPVVTQRVNSADQNRDGVASVTLNFTPEQAQLLGDGGRHSMLLRFADSATQATLTFVTAVVAPPATPTPTPTPTPLPPVVEPSPTPSNDPTAVGGKPLPATGGDNALLASLAVVGVVGVTFAAMRRRNTI